MNCETVKDLLVLLNYGELSFEDEDAVEKHLAVCPSCAGEQRRLEQLDTLLERGTMAAPPDLLARCRRDLASKLAQEQPLRNRFSLAAWWQNAWATPWLKPAAALTLLFVGFSAGRLVHPSHPQFASVQPVTAQPAPERADAAPPAVETEGPVSYEQPRPSYVPVGANVTPDDPRLRELLLTAVSNQDPALRVESIDLLQRRCSDETVRKALLSALRADPNSGVRLKALEALRPYAQNAETRAVLANVVLNDTSPAIRTQAIDLLVQSRDSDVARTLQEVLKREEIPYIRERSVHALRAMKASEETF